jgi:hypothetical protein
VRWPPSECHFVGSVAKKGAHLKRPTMLLHLIGMLLLAVSASADTISINFTSGTAGTSNYQLVSGSITTGNGTVTLTLSNDLTNAQVISIIQNISGIYFNVSGYGGTASLTSSSSDQSTNIADNGSATLGGAVSPTGWAVINNVNGGLAVCVICPGGNPPAGPTQTIIGGTGSGTYANANGSITGNDPHNPFLVSDVTFTLNVAGVTADSDLSNIVIQFGTTATPPTTVPDSSSLSLLLLTGTGIAGLFVRRFTGIG